MRLCFPCEPPFSTIFSCLKLQGHFALLNLVLQFYFYPVIFYRALYTNFFLFFFFVSSLFFFIFRIDFSFRVCKLVYT